MTPFQSWPFGWSPMAMRRGTAGLMGLVLLSCVSQAVAADNVWSVKTLNSRKAEWDQLVGPTLRVEGRVSSQGKGHFRLSKCDLDFHTSDTHLRSLNGKRTVELVGRLKKENGKVSFEVTQVVTLPTDTEQFESRSSKLRNPRPADWYALGEWAAERSHFYGDAELAKKSVFAYSHGVKLEWKSLPANDGEGRIQLARQSIEYKLPDDLRWEILHEGYRTLWLSSLKGEPAGPARWDQLAARLAADLPGCTTALELFPEELKQRYDREALTLYRESSEATRRELHRLLYASIVLKSIESAAASDGRDGNLIADRIEAAVPEEATRAGKYRDAKLAWRSARAATATRQEIEQLASDYRARQQPVPARQALQTWLKSREDRLRDDGSLGLLQLADDHLALLQDEGKAAVFLREAYSLDPSLEEVSLRLEKLGYKLERGAWSKNVAAMTGGGMPKPDAAASGGIAVGMKAAALRGLMGRPESTARALTGTGLVEVWSYGPPGSSRLIVHLERPGPLGELKVIEFGNER